MNLKLLWMASLALTLLGMSKLYSDPSGHHATAAPSGFVGCKIDPDACQPPPGNTAAADGGSAMDPNGS